MRLTLLDILVLSGLILSFFLAILLWTSKYYSNNAHKYYAVTMVSLSLSLLVTWFEELVPSNGILELVSWQFLFPFTFLIYTIKKLQHPLERNQKRWLLLVPCILLSTFQIIDFLLDIDVYYWLAGENEKRYTALIEWITFAFIPYALTLIGYAYFLVREAKFHYQQEKNWFTFNCLSLLAFLMLWLLSDLFTELLEIAVWNHLLVGLSIFLVLATYQGIHILNIFDQRKSLIIQHSLESNTGKAAQAKKLREGSSAGVHPKIKQLNMLMAEKRYFQDPDMTRKIIADQLEISEGYLSELMRKEMATNLNDYLNEFRVRYAIELFKNEKFDIYSIEALGHDAGFKSKSVFYTAFKKVTEKTPAAYRKSMNERHQHKNLS